MGSHNGERQLNDKHLHSFETTYDYCDNYQCGKQNIMSIPDHVHEY